MLSPETRYLLQQILDAIHRIEANVEPIRSSDDFYASPGGMMRLESTCMLLIAIGESLKGIDKLTDRQLLPQYPDVDWKGAKGLRDIIAHRYFEIDAEIVFETVIDVIPTMRATVERIITDNT